ncbi:hypothetical protein LUR56_07740 [Streptomyces sp. MT29]|nr:hypothetical protein [Streptomyces sp. MT29]
MTGPEYFEAPADPASALPGPQLGEIPPQGASPVGARRRSSSSSPSRRRR